MKPTSLRPMQRAETLVSPKTTMAAELDATTVAIAVSGTRSRRAVSWAAVNLIPHASHVLLLHVVPPLVADCSRENTPREREAEGAVQVCRDERLFHTRRIFLPFKWLCQTTREVEIKVLVGKDPALEISRYMSSVGVKILVLGASTFSWFSRTIKGIDVPSTVLKSAPDSCNVFLVSRWKLVFKLARQSMSWDFDTTNPIRKVKLKMLTQRERSCVFGEQISRHISMPSNIRDNTFGVSVRPDLSRLNSHISTDSDDSANDCQNSELPLVVPPIREEQIRSYINKNFLRTLSLDVIPFSENTHLKGDDLEEVKRLKLELQKMLVKYDRACQDLICTRRKAQIVSAEYFEEAKQVKIALEREEILRQVAAEEKFRHMEAIREIDEAKQLLAQAALDKHKAEIRALRMSSDRVKIVDAIFSRDKRCRRYSIHDIVVATDNFSAVKKIGNGGYGNVYRGILDHTPVAIKVLNEDALEMKEQFFREVEVLTRLRHPHMVLLLGVCPEMKCLVYEYMENGSLEDHIFFKDGMQPLSWCTRFRIIFEVACGLAFLHGSKPDPIVHCDLKPGNILLDQNYVSKICDAGLARLMTEVVSDSVTVYRDTLITGTLHYMDPEYQQTGTLRPKSDLYAFGIVVLQLLTARRPLGLLVLVEDAIKNDTVADILDRSVKGWPLAKAEKLAQLALRCSRMKCRDRPDLESEVLPEIEKILEVFGSRRKPNKLYVSTPNHFFCPILQEVMNDPHIAADGFTYEYRAIKSWLTKHNVSPITGLKLEHTEIIPNLTLRSGMLEWRSQMEF